MELAFWQSVVESQDPAAYQAYLDAYPAGHFSPLARLHLDRSSGGKVTWPAETHGLATSAATQPRKASPCDR